MKKDLETEDLPDNKKGITLIALIITIIVLLILAGVSMSSLVGDNGIITNGQIASIESKFAGYREELETNIVSKAEGDREKVNLLNENVKNYIPSLEENDVGRFAVIGGELYYLGNDELSKKAAKNQKMEVIKDNGDIEEFTKDVEKKAVSNIIKEDGIEAFNYTDEKGEESKGGIKLIEKNFLNAKNWKIVTESGEDGSIVTTYDNDYYYVPSGTKINGIGKTSYGYIVNYDNNQVIGYEEGKHKYFS